jgi:hypothetical protein
MEMGIVVKIHVPIHMWIMCNLIRTVVGCGCVAIL